MAGGVRKKTDLNPDSEATAQQVRQAARNTAVKSARAQRAKPASPPAAAALSNSHKAGERGQVTVQVIDDRCNELLLVHRPVGAEEST